MNILGLLILVVIMGTLGLIAAHRERRRHRSLVEHGALGPYRTPASSTTNATSIRLHDCWTWGRYIARTCPGCGCNPDRPCTLTLGDGESTGTCVPAGAYGAKRCSGCRR